MMDRIFICLFVGFFLFIFMGMMVNFILGWFDDLEGFMMILEDFDVN